MAETASARTGAEAIASFGQGRSWESAFRNLNQAIELIYLMCELESSVVFVDHAARVFKEASENFEELKLRIQDQLRFQSYIEESQVDHLSIAWEVPSFKQDYSRNVPEEGAVGTVEYGAQEDQHWQDSPADDDSSLGPFPEHKEWSMNSDRDSATARTVSTGGMSGSMQPLVPWSEACVVAPYHRRPPGLSDAGASPPCSPGDGGRSAVGGKQGERRGASVGHVWDPHRGALAGGDRLRQGSSPRTGRAPVAAGGNGSAPRSLHSKLLSPERFKRDPDETRRLAAEKQQRAERQRSVLEAERKAKLEKAKQEREAVRSVHGEQQAVRQRELRMRHELSQERRRSTLLGIVARATDESDKVKEVQFIRRMEAASLRAALDARLERSGERRRVVLANRQLRHGRDVDDALEDAQRRKRQKEEARMEELFEKLQRKEEARALFEEERRRGARAAAATSDPAAADAAADPSAAAAAAPQHETPKQRRERLEAERAEERHAALERRLQEAGERRERMLEAVRAAAAPGAPAGAAQSSSYRVSPAKVDRARASSCHGSVSVAQESWAHRVLKSRGAEATSGAAAAATSSSGAAASAGGPASAATAAAAAAPARSAAQVYSSMMKTLRSKAAKLRRRLLEEAPLEDVDGGPLGGGLEGGGVALARGVPQELVDSGECLAQEICFAMDAQDPQALVRALRQVENRATAAEPAASPLPPGPEPAPGALRAFHAPPWGPFVSAAHSTSLLRAVAGAAAAAACGGPSGSGAAAAAWPPPVLLCACSALSALLADPCNRVAVLSLPAAVFLIDGLRTLLDAAIGAVAPALPGAPPPTPALDALTSVIVLLLQSSPLAIAARVRRCDVISYALAAGTIYRMAHLFLLAHGAPHAAEVPPCVRRSLALLELLTAVDARAVLHMDGGRLAEAATGEHHVRFRVKGIAANLVTMFKDTSLVGLSALLSAFLHPAASAAPRFWPGQDAAGGGGGSSPPALLRHGRGAGAPALPPPPPAELLPAKLLPAALSAMRALNGVLLLARREVQHLLAAPDLSSELLFVLEAVVTLCTARWPGDDGVVALLLHEAVLLLGLFSAQHPSHQEKLCWGPAPSVLQRLCTIPTLYLETACLPTTSTAPPAVSAASRGEPAAPSAAAEPAQSDAADAAVAAAGLASETEAAAQPEPGTADASGEGSCPGAAVAAEGAGAGSSGTAAMAVTTAAAPPTYLLHVLFPTLLAACLDAPRNCAAVCECLGPAGVLAYCAAQCPSGGGGGVRGSAGGARDSREASGGLRNGAGMTTAGVAAAQHDWDWDVDLGPLDGRFHPRHRIARADWARAEAQLRAAAVHTPRSVSDAASGDSGSAALQGRAVSERHANDGADGQRHFGPGDCVAAEAGAGPVMHIPTASVECDRMPQGCAIRGSDSHEGPA